MTGEVCKRCQKRTVCFLPCGMLSKEKGSPKEKRVKGGSIDIVYMDEASNIDINSPEFEKIMKRARAYEYKRSGGVLGEVQI